MRNACLLLAGFVTAVSAFVTGYHVEPRTAGRFGDTFLFLIRSASRASSRAHIHRHFRLQVLPSGGTGNHFPSLRSVE